jgi:alkylhydroperoxidase/carboxymuconolactone decarboxylase family protein YurZ
MSLADKKRRRTHLDGQIAASPMRVGKAMRAVAKEVFADGALSRKHKELTALAVAVATNCWE